MLLTLFLLLQSQSTKIGWYVWAIAIFFFVLGLGLLIYVMTRPKLAQEDEVEAAVGGLFNAEKQAVTKEETLDEPEVVTATDAVREATVEPEPPGDVTRPLSAVREPAAGPTLPLEPGRRAETAANETRPLASAADELKAVADAVAAPPEPVTPDSSPPIDSPQPVAETALLASQPTETETEEDYLPPPVLEEEEAPSPLPVVESTAAVDGEEGRTRALRSEPGFNTPEEFESLDWSPTPPDAVAEVVEPPAATPPVSRETVQLASLTPDASARVDEPIPQERFESPEPERPRRDPFEPPRIKPLSPKTTSRQTTTIPSLPTPREATERLSSPPSSSPFANDMAARLQAPETGPETQRLGATEPPVTRIPPPLPDDPGTRRTTTMSRPTAQTESAWATSGVAKPDVSTTDAPQKRAARSSPGAILGLPAERSNAPLVLGSPAAAREEAGVSSLSHYGKAKDDADTGRGGLITLAIVILLLGAALGSYVFVPSFKASANRLLGIGNSANEVPLAEKAKAQIIPSRAPEFNKNIVKARGAVRNISEETLDGLSVEIALARGEGSAVETRVVPVTPGQLAPLQQGQYEFEYDGSKSTGFNRYRVTKLIAATGEVKFTTPSQQ